MPDKRPPKKSPRVCPWQNYPTHKRNRQLQVHGDVPLSYGFCGQELACSSCAGTLYKPNILLELGRPSLFVECPHCDPEGYRKRVERLRAKLPKGSGPTTTPLSEAQRAAAEAASDGFEPPRRR
jgi:uncharacterized Zn-finger protein